MNTQRIDLALFANGSMDERVQLSKHFVEILVKHGFVTVFNHGLSDPLISGAFDWMKEVFHMPEEAKVSISNPVSLHPQRGWSGVGVETTASLTGNTSAEFLDAKEHYDFGPPSDQQFPNRWLEEPHLPGFRTFVESYFDTLHKVSLSLIQMIEIGFGLPPDAVSQMCTPNCSELRMNYYPAIEARKLREGKVRRIWPHSDFGTLTLLFRDAVGGLEFEDREHPGTFFPVPRNHPQDMVVNVCDTLQRWTNDVMRAGIHQVVGSQGADAEEGCDAMLPERYSIAYLMKATREASVAPLPQFVTEERPAKYDNITALEYQHRRNHVVYYE